MIVSLSLSSDQIRYYAESALNGFETLTPDHAIENARSEIGAMVEYLNALSPADNAVPIFGLSVIDGGGRLERIGSHAQINNSTDLKVVRR